MTQQLRYPTRKKNVWTVFWKQRRLWVLLLPTLILMGLFCYKPMYGILIAFKNYKVPDGIWGSEWVGLKVFTRMFRSANFIRAFKNTLIISGLKLIFTFPAPVIFALLLNEVKNLRAKKLIQTISYLPHFVSWVVVGALMKELLNTQGPLSELMLILGGERKNFLTDPSIFRLIVILSSIWKDVGWGSIVYLAALSGIDPQLYEAAAIDGANKIKQLWYVTLPALIPTISIMFLMRIGNILNGGFDQIFNLYNELVYSVGDIIDTYSYREGLVRLNYSYATAVGLLKNVIGLLMMLLVNTTVNRKNDYGIL